MPTTSSLTFENEKYENIKPEKQKLVCSFLDETAKK